MSRIKIDDLKSVVEKVLDRRHAVNLDEHRSLKDQGVDSLERQYIFFEISERFKIQFTAQDINRLDSLDDILVFVMKADKAGT